MHLKRIVLAAIYLSMGILMLLGSATVSIAGWKSDLVAFATDGAITAEDGVVCQMKNGKKGQTFEVNVTVTSSSGGEVVLSIPGRNNTPVMVPFPVPGNTTVQIRQAFGGDKGQGADRGVRISFLADNSQDYSGLVSGITHQSNIECIPCGAFGNGNDENKCDSIVPIDIPPP